MFRWAIIFLAVDIVAATFGFSGLAGTAAWAAKAVLVAGLILLVISIIMNKKRSR